MSSFLLHLIVTGVAIYAATQLVSGVHVDSTLGLVLGALVLGFVNAIVRPVMQICPCQ